MLHLRRIRSALSELPTSIETTGEGMEGCTSVDRSDRCPHLAWTVQNSWNVFTNEHTPGTF